MADGQGVLKNLKKKEELKTKRRIDTTYDVSRI
jgi:hypothetical protein